MKIEFIHKHEYDDKTGQWRVKETKSITEEGLFKGLIMGLIGTLIIANNTPKLR